MVRVKPINDTSKSSVASTEYWYEQSKYYAGQAADSATAASTAKNLILNDSGFIAVAGDLTGDNTIGTVATNISNVNTVGGNISNVNAVAGDISKINAVYADLSKIEGVYSNATNINAVAANSTNINTVAGDKTNVDTVATNISSVNSVSTNISNVNAVNSNATNINAVAGNSTNINAVAGNSTNINTVAGAAGNIQTVVNNLSAINAAPANAQTATNKAAEALIWAEGTDAQVQALGGTHSAREWCLYNSTVNQNDVRALESGVNSGELYTKDDSDSINSRLEEITQNAHSTFDLSKFTVVGSPTITSDGIASGFSSGGTSVKVTPVSYLTKPFEIIYQSDFSQDTSGQVFNLDIDYSTYFGYGASTNQFICALVDNTGTTVLGWQDKNNPIDVPANKIYYLKLKWDGTTYYYLVSTDKKNWSTVTTVNCSNPPKISGYDFVQFRPTGACGFKTDLKQFQIIVDGVEVFSGNKTGVDTIKPDDYTLVGSPTISTDGVASGFNGANSYIKFNNSIGTDYSNFEIDFKLNFQNSTTNDSVYAIGAYGGNTLIFGRNANRFQFFIGDGTNWITAEQGTNLLVQNNVDYWVKFKFNGTQYLLDYSLDGENYTNEITYSSSSKMAFPSPFCLGTAWENANFLGSIDLNTFKIYVDGDLVYQSCLKIPYTQSKTGSKIVDSIYLPRVNDMREQYGSAPYYTLLEEDKTNYTVVGSPTISSDYVASGFSSSNYLTTPTIDFTKPFEIIVPFKLTYISQNKAIFQIIGTSGWWNFCYLSSYRLYFSYKLSDSSTGTITLELENEYELNKIYFVNLTFTGSSYTLKLLDENKNILKSNGIESILTLDSSNNSKVNIGYDAHSNYNLSNGSIVLKAFQISVDNKLVYRAVQPPCYTLPQGELYGNIQQTLRNTKQNGIAKNYLYSDRMQIQTGSCTSGTEVTLPVPFADSNYALTVPYSAKTASKFTPTQTGDWIAIGLGVL